MDRSRVPAPPSQPLHYFDLPVTLKWKTDRNPGGNHRNLRSPPPRRPKTNFPASLHQTLSSGSVSSPPPPPRRESRAPVNSQTKQAPIRGESSSSKPLTSQERKKTSPAVAIGGGEPNQKLMSRRREFPFESAAPEASKKNTESAANLKRSKILIKIPNNNDKTPPPPPPPPKEQQNPHKIINNVNCKNDVVEDEARIWNLRPRKITTKKSSRPLRKEADESPPLKSEGNCSGGGAAADVKKGGGGGGGEVKKKEVTKKPIITIELTKREIEEDIYALTGAKPSRRPKRRPKNVQKQLDMVYPGLLLVNSS